MKCCHLNSIGNPNYFDLAPAYYSFAHLPGRGTKKLSDAVQAQTPAEIPPSVPLQHPQLDLARKLVPPGANYSGGGKAGVWFLPYQKS
jgi:hypothetical protein